MTRNCKRWRDSCDGKKIQWRDRGARIGRTKTPRWPSMDTQTVATTMWLADSHAYSSSFYCPLSPPPLPALSSTFSSSPLPPILFHDARSETPINISDFSRSNASEGSVRPRRCAAHPDPWPADPLKTTEKGPSSFSAAPCRKVRHEAHKVNSCGPCAAPYTGA